MVPSISAVVIEPIRSDSFVRRNVLKAIRKNHGDDSDQHPREAIRGSHFSKCVSNHSTAHHVETRFGRCLDMQRSGAQKQPASGNRTMFVGTNRLLELSGRLYRRA